MVNTKYFAKAVPTCWRKGRSVGFTGLLEVVLMVSSAVVAWCGSGCSKADSTPGPHGPVYRLEWEVKAYDEMIVRINDIPAIAFEHPTHMRSGFLYINWFLRDGDNRISVVATKHNEFKGPLRLRLVAVSSIEDVSAGDPLLDIETSSPATEVVFRRTVTIQARVPEDWSWQKAVPVERLTDADRVEILGKIQALHEALVHKDLDRMVGLLRTGGDEMCRALYISKENVDKEGLGLVREVSQMPGFIVEPLDLATVELRVCGTVVVAKRPGGKLISAKAEGPGWHGVYFNRFAFVKVEDKWIPFHLLQ